ncbi:helix-turn-helix domain-containing protein [Martelella radicis]|uniref:HTH-type transcriptional regulator/antitoxin HigA n=1 Tax=Martelella radicis TaxID=1397476 RepID=A0A7W6KHJ0_9HYPH|nr:helix-turn-helix domain-containing protein [Martelella radicis]MBB4121228.1 HTH-type transcriptional regulator/antitoxin HigA [Martelella radicis]
MEPKIIKTEDQYAAAVAEIERLWGADDDTPDGDRLDLLILLVEDYEARNIVPLDVDPIDLLKANMEARGRTQGDLAALIGSKSRASEILNRKRSLTKEQIHLISSNWGIPADLLVKPYALAAA